MGRSEFLGEVCGGECLRSELLFRSRTGAAGFGKLNLGGFALSFDCRGGLRAAGFAGGEGDAEIFDFGAKGGLRRRGGFFFPTNGGEVCGQSVAFLFRFFECGNLLGAGGGARV